MSEERPADAISKVPVGIETVEALVRHQLAVSLGGKRGMLEAGIPGIVFSVSWLTTKNLEGALIASLVVAGAALVVRLLQRSTIQYLSLIHISEPTRPY